MEKYMNKKNGEETGNADGATKENSNYFFNEKNYLNKKGKQIR